MKLYLDTSSNLKTIIKIDDEILECDSSKLHSQVILPMISELLEKAAKKLSDITEIEVFAGPGSFTGLRVGATIANALGYALDVPVNGKHPKKLEIFEPNYE